MEVIVPAAYLVTIPACISAAAVAASHACREVCHRSRLEHADAELALLPRERRTPSQNAG